MPGAGDAVFPNQPVTGMMLPVVSSDVPGSSTDEPGILDDLLAVGDGNGDLSGDGRAGGGSGVQRVDTPRAEAGLQKVGDQLHHDLLRTIEIQQDALRTAQDELAEHDSALAHGYLRHRARRTRSSGLRIPPALLLVLGAVVLAFLGGPNAALIVAVGLVVLLGVLVLGRFVLVLVLVRRILRRRRRRASAGRGARRRAQQPVGGRHHAPQLAEGPSARD